MSDHEPTSVPGSDADRSNATEYAEEAERVSGEQKGVDAEKAAQVAADNAELSSGDEPDSENTV